MSPRAKPPKCCDFATFSSCTAEARKDTPPGLFSLHPIRSLLSTVSVIRRVYEGDPVNWQKSQGSEAVRRGSYSQVRRSAETGAYQSNRPPGAEWAAR
jgi:hypothetical protein